MLQFAKLKQEFYFVTAISPAVFGVHQTAIVFAFFAFGGQPLDQAGAEDYSTKVSKLVISKQQARNPWTKKNPQNLMRFWGYNLNLKVFSL
jgi:hypothetical protein